MLEGRPDVGVLVGGVLQFDHRQRQAVDEQHHVRPARVLPFGDGELVDREPVVVVGALEVDHTRLRAGDRAVLAPVLDGDAVHQHAMKSAVAFDAAMAHRSHELPEGVLQRLARQVRVEGFKSAAQPGFENRVTVAWIYALRATLAGGDVGTVKHGVAKSAEPFERGLFDDGFAE